MADLPEFYYTNDQDEIARRKEIFLQTMEKTGNIAASCRASGIPRSTANSFRKTDPEFGVEWDIAFVTAIDSLEQEAWRRARDGVAKPVYQGGQLVGHTQEYSDSLLTFLLRGHRSEVFNLPSRTEVTGPQGQPFFESLMQNLATVYGNGDKDLDIDLDLPPPNLPLPPSNGD